MGEGGDFFFRTSSEKGGLEYKPGFHSMETIMFEVGDGFSCLADFYLQVTISFQMKLYNHTYI